MARILVIDASPSVRLATRRSLENRGHRCAVVESVDAALGVLRELDPELLVLDAALLHESSAAAIRDRLSLPEATALVVWADRDQLDSDRTFGADPRARWICRPSDFSELEELLATAFKPSTAVALAPADELPPEGQLLWCSEGMRHLHERILQLAPHDLPVLIEGESGTGKELVALALHRGGPHPEEPFVAIHCGAIPSELLESELFGFERGSFTDAHRSRRGRFELAGSGTLLLDEIGEMAPQLQSKLLRVLQERRIERVGGHEPIPLRARVIAATHRDLRAMIQEGSFRRDLFYRLAVATIQVPPLRTRPEDLRLLIRALLARFSVEYGKQIQGIDRPALQRLLEHSWPGNVRELENVLRRAVVLTRGQILGIEALELASPTSPPGNSEVDSGESPGGARWQGLLGAELRERLRHGESLQSVRRWANDELNLLLRALPPAGATNSPEDPASPNTSKI